MKLDKDYQGVLHRDVECDEFLYDEHLTFIETAPQTAVKRNPQVFCGKYVTITRWADGSLHPHLKHIDIGDGFDIIGYATAVGNELLWALEGLIEKLHNKSPDLITDVVHWLTSETVLEQMTVALIFLVEMVCVRYGDALDNLANGCRLFLN